MFTPELSLKYRHEKHFHTWKPKTGEERTSNDEFRRAFRDAG
jgi:hypothetical protein